MTIVRVSEDPRPHISRTLGVWGVRYARSKHGFNVLMMMYNNAARNFVEQKYGPYGIDPNYEQEIQRGSQASG